MSSLIFLFNACLITSTGRRGCRGETNSRTPLFASLFSQLMMSTWTWWPSTSWLILCEGSLSANLTTSKWLLTLWLLGVLIICRFTTSMLSTRSFGTATVYELPSGNTLPTVRYLSVEPGSDNQYRLSLILASIIMIIAIIAKIGFDYESIIVDYRTIMQSLWSRSQRSAAPERTRSKTMWGSASEKWRRRGFAPDRTCSGVMGCV